MGVVTKRLARIDLNDNKCEFFEIELNEPNVVHIQNCIYRIELTIEEFNIFSVTCIEAADKLKKIKQL